MLFLRCVNVRREVRMTPRGIACIPSFTQGDVRALSVNQGLQKCSRSRLTASFARAAWQWACSIGPCILSIWQPSSLLYVVPDQVAGPVVPSLLSKDRLFPAIL